MHKAHVFLGPSLDLVRARQLFPNAYYHPPVQCGDIIRLLRLSPKLIVLIDGLYETTPAVWHKELLLALELGIEIWGAASMGALRAAELHQYGMHGFGEVFLQFKEGTLNDDDEVAVLHLSGAEHFTAINDAMVNIRATCNRAVQEAVLTQEASDALITYCKAQFYPYRSLLNAVQHLSLATPQPYAAFITWFAQHGIIDVKGNDAQALLSYLHSRAAVATEQKAPEQALKSMTCFLRELIVFANATPLGHCADELPEIEQQIYQLHQQSPFEYMLLTEIVALLQKLAVFSADKEVVVDQQVVATYLHEHQLYCPADDFVVFKHHAQWSSLYALIGQAICLGHITAQQLEDYLPALAHYYDVSAALNARIKKSLRIILVLIFSINQHVPNPNLQVAPRYLKHHLKQIKGWRRYTPAQLKHWLAAVPGDRAVFSSLLNAYLMASSVHALSTARVDYYQWIYDGYAMLFCVDRTT